MTILTINTGSSPNAGDGDTLRTAFNKINYNFSQVALASQLGDITFSSSTISTNNTGEDITIRPNAAGLKIDSTASLYQLFPDYNPYVTVSAWTTQTVTLGTGTYTEVINTQTTLFSIDYSGDVVVAGTLTANGIESLNGVFDIGPMLVAGTIISTGTVQALEGIIIGSTTLNNFGTALSVTSGTLSASLASTTTFGVVEIGNNIQVTSGTISVSTASYTTPGVIIAGTGTSLDSLGTLTINTATNSSLGVIKAGTGITMSGDGTLNVIPLPGSLTVAAITTGTSTVISNNVVNVTNLLFDTEAGFTVNEYSTGTAIISMNSTFKYWEVDGQQTLIANGLDTMHFIAGPGIRIITSATSAPQSIEFDVEPATTSTLGGIIVGQGLIIDSTGTLSIANVNANALGDLLVDQGTLYANSSSIAVGMRDSIGNNFISVPSANDQSSLLTVSGYNGTLITAGAGTDVSVAAGGIFDTGELGGVTIYSYGTAASAGIYLASSAAGIYMYSSSTYAELSALSLGVDSIGALDLATHDGESISIRPGGLDNGGTGTVYIPGTLVVENLTVTNSSAQGGMTVTYAGAGTAGGLINNSDYQSLPLLNLNSGVLTLDQGDYYLPNGTEGQQIYFVPTNASNSGTSVIVWLDSVRFFTNGIVTTATAQAWYPFFTGNTGFASAIFAGGAWNLDSINLM